MLKLHLVSHQSEWCEHLIFNILNRVTILLYGPQVRFHFKVIIHENNIEPSQEGRRLCNIPLVTVSYISLYKEKYFTYQIFIWKFLFLTFIYYSRILSLEWYWIGKKFLAFFSTILFLFFTFKNTTSFQQCVLHYYLGLIAKVLVEKGSLVRRSLGDFN